MKGWCLRFGFASSFRKDETQRKRNADRRSSSLPCCWHGRALSRSAHAYRRSTAVLPPGLFIARVQLQAMLPGTRRSADPVTSAFRRQNRTQFVRALPAPKTCPSPASTSRPSP